MSKTIEPAANCPECGGDTSNTEDYKGIPIFICEDCNNRFGFVSKKAYQRTVIRVGSKERAA